MDDAVLQIRLESIDNRLGLIESHLARLNSSVAKHETKLAQNDVLVTNLTNESRVISDEARISSKTVSDMLVELAKYDTAREASLRELRNVQEVVGEHETYIQRQKGGTQVRVLLYSIAGSLIAMGAGVATILLFAKQFITGHP